MVGLSEGCYSRLLWLVWQRVVIFGCYGWFVRGSLQWVVIVGLSEGCHSGLLWLVWQRVVIVGCCGLFGRGLL